ncbi:MAG TPA: anthranilate synthase component I family protein [Polyangiaceae bacterium]|nr:anthranilate synthase component I family protein [Polyangiaceae bacterium]
MLRQVPVRPRADGGDPVHFPRASPPPPNAREAWRAIDHDATVGDAVKPICTETLVADRLTPVLAYAALRRAAPGPSFLLESVVAGERWGRYSILGYRPRREVILRAPPQGQNLPAGDPFSELAQQISVGAAREPEMAARFARAHVGYLAYDLVHFATKVDRWPEHQPLARFVSDATVVVFDNLQQTVTIAAADRADVERARADLEKTAPLFPLAVPDKTALPSDVDVLTDDATYESGARRAKEYIAAGDAFQIQLGRTMVTRAGDTDPFDVYRALRVLSPSPYMYFVDFPEQNGIPSLQIAGASPETLVRLEDETITVRPLAGTRRRGRTPAEDIDLARELLADPKELAEHVMLIDLARNDVGKVATTGSVKIPLRMQIERFSHVMHIVSEVSGKVRPDLGPWDVVRSAFPAGTLTGTPKVRAMQIIRELEPRARGVYGGAVGHIGPSRDLDLAIAIRTILCQNGNFEITAAAGIVEGSVPALEAKETRNKSRAALAAIRAARGK